MIALLVFSLAALQEPAADVLKKVEEKYAAAKGLYLNAEIQISGKKDGNDVAGKLEVEFRSTGDGKVRAEISGTMNGQNVPPTVYVSDGKSIASLSGKERPLKKGAPPALGTWARKFAARTGVLGSTSSLFGAVFQSQVVKVDDLFKVSDVADAGWEKYDGRERRVITFTVAAPEPGSPPLKCKIWIDHKNFTVLKRESKQTTSTGTVTITETYAEATFDADLPDDTFKVE